MASRSLDDLAPPVKAAALAMVSNAKRGGVAVLIHCTLRSNEEQEKEYAWGRSKAGAVRTNCRAGMSLHNPDKNGKAWAFDAVPVVNGVAQWNDFALLEKMGRFGETAGLEWSGRWTGKLKETGHFQMDKNKQAQGLIDPETMGRAAQSVTITGFASQRLREPSTWAGISGIAAALAFFFPQYAMILNTVAGISGTFAAGKPDA